MGVLALHSTSINVARSASPSTVWAVPDAGLTRLGQVGALSLFHAAANPHQALRLNPPPGAKNPMAVVLADATVVLQQFGRTVELAPGEWTLVRSDRSFDLESSAQLRIAGLPDGAFYEHGISLQSLALRPFRRTQSINRIVFSLFTSIFDEASGLGPGDGQELAQAALHVTKKALLDACATPAAKTILMTRIRELIDWRIRDPRLSPDQIAKALNCTPRNIHRAFEGEAETLGQYILRRRLERCREDLLAAELGQKSVTEIAFSWGFNNAAHFSRVYRKQFGQAPSACRGRQGLRKAAAD